MSADAGLAIVGAGAAGLAAAIAAAEAMEERPTGRPIVLLEGATTIGAKILVSGGGRCNVTHDVVTPEDFFGNRRIIRNVLAAFPAERTVRWFASLGVELKREESGKLFPVTDKARTVLDALLTRTRKLGVDLRPDHRVQTVSATASGFEIRHRHGALYADRIILATGGRSLPKTGSDGWGYRLARSLGHEVTATVPALVPLLLAPSFFHAHLSGLSQDIALTTVVDGQSVDRRTGSLLWTHVGISGPVVMDASRWWTWAVERGETVELYGHFLPGSTEDEVRAWLTAEAAQHPRRSLLNTLATRLPDRFAERLCRHLAVDPQRAMAQVPRSERDRLRGALTKLRFPVERDRGWNHAEVTAGGVPLDQIDYRTMESKVAPGLYLIGELLDCDGRIGGFNFQWAWATGYVAGRAAAWELLRSCPEQRRKTEPLRGTMDAASDRAVEGQA